jgi:hypothetical protein
MRLLMRVSLVLRVNSEDSANSCLHAHTLSTQVSASRLSSQSCIGANYDVGSKYFYFFYYSAIGDWGIGIFVVVVGDSAKLLSPPRTKKKKKSFFCIALFFFHVLAWRCQISIFLFHTCLHCNCKYFIFFLHCFLFESFYFFFFFSHRFFFFFFFRLSHVCCFLFCNAQFFFQWLLLTHCPR